MLPLSKELVFLVLQFLDEEKYKDTVHKLEQESGIFFNMAYFEEKVLTGDWKKVEKYLSSFTKLDDNRYSMKIYFEIRKQKYLEALDRHDTSRATEILLKDLKFFSSYNDELYKEIAYLLTLDNFRENEQLAKYGDVKSARAMMMDELKKLILANPVFRDKLAFPSLKTSRLRTMINQSLNWQHQLCKNPVSNPDIKTLYTDHNCTPPNGARASTSVPVPVAKPSTYAPLGAIGGGPFMPASAAANVNPLGWMANANPSSSAQPPIAGAPLLSTPPNQVPILKHPRTPNTLGMMDPQNNDQDPLLKRLRTAQSADEVTYPAPSQQASLSLDDIPKSVVCTFHHGSTVTSMDFHPSFLSVLAVGCANGEILLWEAGLREKLMTKPFSMFNVSTCSVLFQATIMKDSSISVSRVSWSPDGNLIGVAYSKHLIQLYAYQPPSGLHQRIEIDAHVGCVNDLAFAYPNKQLCIVTCGDDKLVKVWDLTGQKLFNFEGHEAPVYSVCPHHKERVQFIFSTSVDGKIKAWLYDSQGCRMDYNAPGQCCTTMLYSADRTRLFSCGTSKDGDSFLVEWNEREGAIKRTYSGLRKKSAGIVQFDIAKSRLLAAGEDNQVKFWDVDNTNILISTEAEGGLPSLPRLRFNKEGNLLAVNTADSGLKVLANAEGIKFLKTIEARSYDATKAPIDIKNGVDSMARSTENKRNLDDGSDRTKAPGLTEIVDPVQCRTVTLPDGMVPFDKVARLLYTNSGVGLLVLGSKGVKLYRWGRSEQNQTGKATTSIVPILWQPSSGLPYMINDIPNNSEAAFPCMAISKNDSYVMSSSGGKATLFKTMTFREMTTFMEPPPTPCFLAFNPEDNNVTAIGMEDTSIHIYNVKEDQVIARLRGHRKHITGLSFSTELKILVSSGADAQLCFWRTDSWEKKKTIAIQMEDGKAPVGDPHVQFHIDQVTLLVFHETQLALYDASKMELTRKWVPQGGLSGSITCATYSCNGQLIYATFTDGYVGVFDADTLTVRCRMASSAYLHQPSSISQKVYPVAVAANPKEAYQFAIGLSDGSVKVLEPTEPEGAWGVQAPHDNANAMHSGRTASPPVITNDPTS